MILRDFNLKLDRRGLISLTQEDSLFYYLKRVGQYIPAFIFSSDSKVFLSMFIPRANVSGEIMTFLKSNEAKEWKDSYVVTRRINNVSQLKIISELVKVPTVVSNHLYIQNGTIHFDFRFHHTYLDNVSAELVKYTANFEKTRILDFGKCDGLTAVLKRIQDNMDLTMIRWRVPLTDELGKLLEPLGDCVVETENLQVDSELFRTIVYTNSDSPSRINPKLSEVSSEDGVYRLELNHPVLVAVRNRLNEESIPRVAYFFQVEDGYAKVSAFVPSHLSEEYLRVLLSVARDNPDYKITLVASRSLKDTSLYHA